MRDKIFKKIMVAALCPLLCLLLFGCFGKKGKVDVTSATGQNQSYVPGQLIGTFDSESEAKEAALLYEIELESYRGGVAVFRVDKDLQETISLGEKNGWPPLYLNHIYKIDE